MIQPHLAVMNYHVAKGYLWRVLPRCMLEKLHYATDTLRNRYGAKRDYWRRGEDLVPGEGIEAEKWTCRQADRKQRVSHEGIQKAQRGAGTENGVGMQREGERAGVAGGPFFCSTEMPQLVMAGDDISSC